MNRPAPINPAAKIIEECSKAKPICNCGFKMFMKTHLYFISTYAVFCNGILLKEATTAIIKLADQSKLKQKGGPACLLESTA